MRSKVSLIALRIAALKEEFSENEIVEAVKFLEQKGSTSALLTYLTGDKRELKTRHNANRKSKPIEDQRSKALIGLEHKDPEKYQVLSEFDLLLRKSSVLPEVEDIKRIGRRLSKEFSTKSSRRESISKLMALLVERPIDDIRELIRSALSTARVDEKDSDYQRLAQFIITGRLTQTESEQSLSLTPSTQR
jgi:hypothetical protein